MKKLKKENKGFSLVELIVVVLILGILAVAVTPQIMNWIDKSKVGKDEAYAGGVSTAVESVALEYIGKGKAADIVTPLKLTSGGIDGVAAGFKQDVQDMIGKYQSPEASGKTYFEIVISVSGSTATVTTTAKQVQMALEHCDIAFYTGFSKREF